MKLYYTKGACSLAPHFLINELNLPSEFESVDLSKKVTEKGDDFFKINPKGAVPTLITDAGETLTENAVILQYLADSQSATQLLPPLKDFNRYRVLEWVNFVATELHKGFGPLFNSAIPQELKDQVLIPLLKKKLDYVNKSMKGPYLLGKNLTLPDVYLCVMLIWAKNFKIDLEGWPALKTFFTEMKNRPAIQKTFQQEGLKI